MSDQPGSTPIDAYLDRLLLELQGNAPDVRRVLAEAEQHLRDAADEGVQQGLATEEAERLAVERFGPALLVAKRFAADTPFSLGRATLVQVVLALVLLGSVGMLAIGVSGAVAAGMGSAWGKSFVSGDAPDITYTADRCAYFLEYYPSPTCEQAATAHHYDEVVFYRLAAGVLGLVALGVYALARQRMNPRFGVLPDGFIPTIGAAVFGIAGVGLTLAALAQVPAGSSNGVGANLSGGVVSLLVAAWFGWSLLRVLAVRAARAGAVATG